ncbi:phosphonate ABC transporter substrate-binding protein [Rhizobium sp. Leaf306]|uniref:phosphonate ABC transporter substrate-binding protein n=1 Tax=Rhizobium/Agrobacterium group TaxID=227290 RepID=UPI0007159A94|nr:MULTISPECIES: phosphonate ABC transporter substrate-binding protein [unclassified Rhizobium]RYE66534.1 MAG: phosphonate ABC transporter substrate-binding protein [Rhizobiaceae bacterium]KQQ39016.1 phosphonate ABC transporter substrate-binding protein [Rhizobium sp. Leaf306]MBP2463067.1 phosphonate transport system substrate-binding protein [Rhizobium sp. PvP014]MBP2530461.1 phosphonate transport system substrate-binding protein [Rhizobium sp. PvP099]SEH28979.1 phosphonate transport system s
MFRKTMLAAATLSLLAGSALAQDVKVLRIGLDGSENEADQIRNTQCVADGLKAATGVSEVKLFPSPNYNGVIQGLLGGTIDIASMGAASYAAIALKDDKAVDPILTYTGSDGSSGYYSIMVARKDSGIKTLADLKGKKIGFADPDSTSGYLVPNVALPKEIGMPVKQYFSETGFGGGHENLVLAVLDKKFDAGTTFGSGVGKWEEGYSGGNLHQMVAKGNLDMDDIVQVWKSPLIPNGPLMVSNKVPADMKAKVKAFFMELPKKNLACFQSFTQGKNKDYIEVNPAFYQTIVDARKSVIGG